MKWKLESREPASLVYYFAKFVGLAPFTLRNKRFYSPGTSAKLYVLLVSAMHSALTIAVFLPLLKSVQSSTLPTLVRISVSIDRVTRLPITSLTLITFLLMNKKILHVLNKLRTISNEFKSLGIDIRKLDEFFKKLIITVAQTTTVFIAISVVLSIVDRNRTIITDIRHAIRNWFHLNLILLFSQTLLFIKQCFKLINEKLYKLFSPVNSIRILHHSRIFVASRNPWTENRGDVLELSNLQRFRKIETLHQELSDLVDHTTHIFTAPIFLKSIEIMGGLMAHLLWMLYVLRKSFQISQSTDIYWTFTNIFSSTLRAAFVISQMIAIAYASATTCQEGNATRAVLFKVWYKFKPRKQHHEFVMFSLQLKHRPVNVSVLGSINLGYSYIYQIFCTVVTYVTIVIQFNT